MKFGINLLLFAASLSTVPSVVSQSASVDYDAEAALRIDTFRHPEGLTVDLWADSSQVKNATAIAFDGEGRLYVCEIHRWRKGVDDIRQRRSMLLEDILIESSADRLAMFKNHLDEFPMSHYTKEADLIRVVEDVDRDGRADKSRVYAGGFNDPLDGPGMGVIERDGIVYYTNIPHLWKLEDTDGDGLSDKRSSIQDGFGIRMSFSGHDMHGLAWGPDGKLYWSMGDRGYNVKTKEGAHYYGPNRGAVFRVNPDGSDLELFYKGLRNPQEIAFDDYGNLFTVDNDGDAGDRERIAYLVEGGDSGWHAGWQAVFSFVSDYKLRSSAYTGEKKILNPWLTEHMWELRQDGQPAFVLPPIGLVTGGPAGLVFNPSSSFGSEYDDKFFVLTYTSSPTSADMEMFNVEEAGAGYEVTNHEVFFSGTNSVDLDFGPDGKMYLSEYNYGGWLNEDVGNVYTLYFAEEQAKAETTQNETILLSKFSEKKIKELVTLLGRDHQKVRQNAQFELTKRGRRGERALARVAKAVGRSPLERVHAVWGIGMMARENSKLLKILYPLINDEDSQVRIQVARVLGDNRDRKAARLLKKALEDTHPRVAMYAGIGLGRIGDREAIPDLVDLLEKNQGEDLWLQHGAVMGLAGIEDKDALMKYASHESKYVRMGILLALRQTEDARIADFLSDDENEIVYEAARAINDLPIPEAQSDLAGILDKLPPVETSIDALMHHRTINANYYLAKEENAKRILDYAANTALPQRQRQEALAAIEGWEDNHPLDTITGLPRKDDRARADIVSLVHERIDDVLAASSGPLLVQAIRVADVYGYELTDARLIAFAENSEETLDVREGALRVLAKRKTPASAEAISRLTSDADAKIRMQALEALLEVDSERAVKAAVALTKSGPFKDRQSAYRIIEGQQAPEVAQALQEGMQALLDGSAPAKLKLEILEVSRKSEDPTVKALVANYDESMTGAPVMKRFDVSLEGGDIGKGRDVFLHHGIAQCVRCHKINGFGADIGPDLSSIGADYDRRYLLEALVDPGASVAPGFGIMSLNLKDGSAVSGIYMKEDAEGYHLKMEDDKIKIFPTSEVASALPPVSGMPPMEHLLKPGEVRDLVSYLRSLKGKETETH